MKYPIKKGDLVFVLSGDSKHTKDEKPSKVLEVFYDENPRKQHALVEGRNIVKRHTKPSATNPQGGIIEKEAPIHISNLMVADPKTGQPSRIGRRKNAEGKSERYAKKSGEALK
ncbi:50S ribosomal protein L24 [bacterium]|nr:50S ribosomal protein L24 [bacterium]